MFNSKNFRRFLGVSILFFIGLSQVQHASAAMRYIGHSSICSTPKKFQNSASGVAIQMYRYGDGRSPNNVSCWYWGGTLQGDAFPGIALFPFPRRSKPEEYAAALNIRDNTRQGLLYYFKAFKKRQDSAISMNLCAYDKPKYRGERSCSSAIRGSFFASPQKRINTRSSGGRFLNIRSARLLMAFGNDGLL